MPASTQVATLSAASGDSIRCEAVIAGEFASLQWRGPNDDTGSQTTFSTAVGAPRQGGAPYDIGLTVNWGGNPIMAHVSVLPDARAQVIIITAQPGCFIIPGFPFLAANPVIPPTVACPLPGVPSTTTSTITVGY